MLYQTQTAANPPVVTVSQVNKVVSMLIKSDRRLANVAVRGEVSNFVCHKKTGHLYFTLTDGKTQLKAVMFAGHAAGLNFSPADGDVVICTGQITTYEPSGVYQINCTGMRPDGEGAQAAALEELKKRLLAQGVFSQKRPIPPRPRNIAVVTAPGGAALQDIINIISRRYPLVKLTVVPALVQGVGAPQSVARALRAAQNTGADVIIVGRGGGSAEDLSAFNTEEVARAVYESRIPTISAVGHETDTTLCDYAADLRAPTPSAAAELAVPDRAELAERLDGALEYMRDTVYRRLNTAQNALNSRGEIIRARSPKNIILAKEQRVTALAGEIALKMNGRLDAAERGLARYAEVISALDPLGVMARGFSVTKRGERIVKSAGELAVGDVVEISFSSGSAAAQIQEIKE